MFISYGFLKNDSLGVTSQLLNLMQITYISLVTVKKSDSINLQPKNAFADKKLGGLRTSLQTQRFRELIYLSQVKLFRLCYVYRFFKINNLSFWLSSSAGIILIKKLNQLGIRVKDW